jgi:hypothetical protein
LKLDCGSDTAVGVFTEFGVDSFGVVVSVFVVCILGNSGEMIPWIGELLKY